MANALNWFEIPATDINRAAKFYGSILKVKLVPAQVTPGIQMAMFPAEDGVGGGIVQGDGYVPSTTGSVIYLNGGDDLATVLDRVEGAGGQITLPKTGIGENGFMAFFLDSEGNKVALHSMG